MAVSIPNRYPVTRTPEQRDRLTDLTRNGHAPAKKIRHAQILLLSDGDRAGGRLTHDQIPDRLGMHVNTVDRIRKRFVPDGEAPALNRKPRATPRHAPKNDGRVEAHLVAICCGRATEGRTYWTLRILADELKERKLVTGVCVETVRKVLTENSCSRGERSAGASRSGTTPGSSPRWRTSSTGTSGRTRPTSR